MFLTREDGAHLLALLFFQKLKQQLGQIGEQLHQLSNGLKCALLALDTGALTSRLSVSLLSVCMLYC